jgi:hypothetical protein
MKFIAFIPTPAGADGRVDWTLHERVDVLVHVGKSGVGYEVVFDPFHFELWFGWFPGLDLWEAAGYGYRTA